MFSMAPAPVRAEDESELATKTRNPVADLISGVGSFAGDSMRKDVHQILIQPFVNYDLPSDCHINSGPIITAGWNAEADHKWTLPTDATLLERSVPAASALRSVVPPAAGEPGDLEDYDPWEEFNAKTFEFNRRMDKYALKPVAMGWKTVVPQPAGIMIAKAFDNLNVVPRVVNNLLQGKWDGAGREVSRFLINSTAGVGGLFDPAKDIWHITKSPADFGQTLGKWGIGPGPYLVLPFMEPLTVRDGIGKVIDRTIDPLTYVVPLIPALSLVAGNRVNERALNYELFAAFDDEVLDAYSAVRNGYLRLREQRVND
jgi:phospholipid-binding lipoprotein MlaA